MLQAVKKAVARGEHFEEHLSQIHTLNAHQEKAAATETLVKRSSFILALLPLLVVIVS